MHFKLNNIYHLLDIPAIFKSVKTRTDDQTDTRANQIHKHFSTILESDKNNKYNQSGNQKVYDNYSSR